jgi:hypothetical protein
MNQFGVSLNISRQDIRFVYFGRPLTKEEAINLAVWLTLVADPDGKEFEKQLKAAKK